MKVRPATVHDAPGILEIYNHEVETSVVTFDLVPRTLDEQRTWLEDRSGAHAVLVAITHTGGDHGTDADAAGADDAANAANGGGERIVGFAALSPYRDRPAYSTTVEGSVYVRDGFRTQGIGRLLLAALVETATQHGFHALMARVVGGHEASIALHRAAGYEIVGHEREVGRKFGRWLDVVLLERLL